MPQGASGARGQKGEVLIVFFGFASRRTRRIAVSAAVLVLGLAVGPFTAHRAGATFSTCDTDPIVFLTDGTVLGTTVHIEDAADDVSRVAYTVHAPQGTRMKGVVFPPSDPLRGKETLQFLADQQEGTFQTDTLVSTGVGQVPISMTTFVLAYRHGHAYTYGAVAGLSNQTLTLSL